MTPTLILSLTALVVAASGLSLSLLSWWNFRSLNRLRQTFFAGSTGADMETVINSLAENFRQLEREKMTLEETLRQLKANFGLAVQKVGVVRYNPFDDGGGNFSFSIALLDGRGSGTVITSLHGRQQNRTYAKRIRDGRGDSELTEEEQQAVRQATEDHYQHII